jgi:hypothetical protein
MIVNLLKTYAPVAVLSVLAVTVLRKTGYIQLTGY